MHVWYKAVCDEHKEMCDVIVNNPQRTFHFLGDDDTTSHINMWLEKHYGCNLRLIHRDEQLDDCYDLKYKLYP